MNILIICKHMVRKTATLLFHITCKKHVSYYFLEKSNIHICNIYVKVSIMTYTCKAITTYAISLHMIEKEREREREREMKRERTKRERERKREYDLTISVSLTLVPFSIRNCERSINPLEQEICKGVCWS